MIKKAYFFPILAVVAVISYVVYFNWGPSPSYEFKDRSQSEADDTFQLSLASPTLSGSTFDSQDYTGKKLIVNYWATWCLPCRAEIPHFIQLQEAHPDKVQIVGVSVDHSVAAILKYVDETPFNYPILLVSPEIDAIFGQVPALPSTFIFDEEHRLTHYLRGYQPSSLIQSIILN